MSSLLLARAGFEAPGAEEFYWQPIWNLHLGPIDLSINRTVLIVFVATALVAGLFLIGFRKPKLVPSGVQNIAEFGVDFVRDNIVLPVIGPRGLVYLPYLTTLFFFIFFCNLFEVIPGVNFPPTSRIGIPAVLAVVSWIVFVITGMRNQGTIKYFKDMMLPPGVPALVLLILAPIELVSTLVVRPFTLAVRLMANMIAGHSMLTICFLGTAYLIELPKTAAFGVIVFISSVGLVGFEVFIAGLQAFIFAILTAVYIAGSLESAH